MDQDQDDQPSTSQQIKIQNDYLALVGSRFEKIPIEVIEHILLIVARESGDDIRSCGRVCRIWRRLAKCWSLFFKY